MKHRVRAQTNRDGNEFGETKVAVIESTLEYRFVTSNYQSSRLRISSIDMHVLTYVVCNRWHNNPVQSNRHHLQNEHVSFCGASIRPILTSPALPSCATHIYCHSPALISGQVDRVQTGRREVKSGVRSRGRRLEGWR